MSSGICLRLGETAHRLPRKVVCRERGDKLCAERDISRSGTCYSNRGYGVHGQPRGAEECSTEQSLSGCCHRADFEWVGGANSWTTAVVFPKLGRSIYILTRGGDLHANTTPRKGMSATDTDVRIERFQARERTPRSHSTTADVECMRHDVVLQNQSFVLVDGLLDVSPWRDSNIKSRAVDAADAGIRKAICAFCDRYDRHENVAAWGTSDTCSRCCS
ncbi:hypothetical protein BC835DRAFT_939706 [Cytidiella melzeri]|nr:hypothetical protein BC835DRAFT_939706 [Cytidiella melzeri]